MKKASHAFLCIDLKLEHGHIFEFLGAKIYRFSLVNNDSKDTSYDNKRIHLSPIYSTTKFIVVNENGEM